VPHAPLDIPKHLGYITPMAWEIEFTDEFRDWWNTLTEKEQGAIDASVKLLEEFGPGLGVHTPIRSRRRPSMPT